MAFQGFDKNSGPGAPPKAQAQTPFGYFPRPPSPTPSLSSPPLQRSPRELEALERMHSPPLAFESIRSAVGPTYTSQGVNRPTGSSPKWGDGQKTFIKDYNAQAQQRPAAVRPFVAFRNSATGLPTKSAQVQDLKRTRSPPLPSTDEDHLRNSGTVIGSHSVTWRTQSPPLNFQNNRSLDDLGPSFSEAQRPMGSSSKWGDGGNGQKSFIKDYNAQTQQRPSSVTPFVAFRNSGTGLPVKSAQVQDLKRTRSPPLLSTDEDHLRNSRTVIGSRSVTWGTQSPPLNIQNYHSLDDLGPAFSEAQRPEWANQPKLSSNFPHLPTQQDLPFVSPYVGTYDSIRNFPTIQSDVHAPKRTRSPPIQYTSEPSREDSLFAGNDSKRPSLSPPILGTRSNGRFNILDTQNHSWSPPSAHVIDAEAAATKPTNFAVPKRTRSPSLPSSDQVFQGNSYSAHDDSERELQAKAKRLARFKDELSQPEQSNIGIGNQKVPVKRHDQSAKQKFIGEPSDMAGDFPNADYEGPESSSIIIGLCPDMCPEMERGERERKGDLDHYERLDGDRNQTNKSLAVKKYTRTAEREANLIRPMPILQKTLDYLLNLLDQPYDDRFLSLYNFLWDRMRAIRMDLRMQHIFNLEAITMLEQMIRLHIIAMHELCEYTKGEGFSEGFDAHLNIEQMNKTSVELFQLYDDHRKRGSDVPTEKEFRGYYALLKLDKHPGYKVEPAELSLDLAKMTPEIRQTPEVLFARDVARACRTGNFIAFFRLARKASYLQACLMHAHFAKLRSQALASIHCGLQNNQGIPVAHVATWLGMEEEDIENLVEYHGYLIKEFEEPYMVKEGPFLNGDDYPLKCSKLVHKKKSKRIVENVSSPCLMELMSSKEVKELQSDKVYENEPPPVLFSEIKNSAHAIDDEMPDYEAVSSPKDDLQVKPMLKTLVVGQWSGDDHQMVAVSPLPRDFSLAHSSLELPEARARSEEKSNSATFFRNSLEKNVHSDMKATPLQIMPKRVELDRLPVLQMDSAMENPVQQSLLIKDSECEEHTSIHQEVETDEVNTSYDYEEVAEAKLKLILRIWRRRSSKKRELREQKQLAANAALSSLSMGTPIWSYNDWPSICHQFNIDRVMSERSDKHERSWSRLNVSDVIATKLSERNPNAKCLCWKMILCFQMDNTDGAKLASWLRSKLMPSRKSNDEDDLVISSTDLSIWKKWVPSHSNGDLTCCLSVIKDAKFNSLHESIVGASAILFVVYESIPWELQKIHLHNLLMCLPSGSHFPLLILSGSEKDYSDPSTIAQNLGLHEVDKSQISTFLVVSLVQNQHMEHLDGFFSDEQLREGLQWLASRSPLQPVLRCVKPRELVLTYLSPSLEVLDGFSAYKVSPDHCISALNEALDRSIEEVSAAANANPSCWPCPEITSLVESSNEHKAVEWYLPSIGWSSSARIEPLLGALSHCKLPTFSDDTSWLSRGSEMGNDIEDQSLQLEECLVQYLTQSSQIMGLSLAKNEARIMLQKCARLELHNSTYYIVPNWVMIFRRIFNWQLMNLSNGVFSSSAYILEQQNSAITTSGGLDKLGLEGGISSHYYLIHPSLDEMVEVGCSSFIPRLQPLEYEACEPFSGRVSNGSEVQKAINESASTEVERNFVQDGELFETNKDNLTNGLSNTSSGLVVATKATKEADRLSKLLEQCNIVQNMIDKKLGIYF